MFTHIHAAILLPFWKAVCGEGKRLPPYRLLQPSKCQPTSPQHIARGCRAVAARPYSLVTSGSNTCWMGHTISFLLKIKSKASQPQLAHSLEWLHFCGQAGDQEAVKPRLIQPLLLHFPCDWALPLFLAEVALVFETESKNGRRWVWNGVIRDSSYLSVQEEGKQADGSTIRCKYAGTTAPLQ